MKKKNDLRLVAENLSSIFLMVKRGTFTIILFFLSFVCLPGRDNHRLSNSTTIECEHPIIYSQDNNTVTARGNVKLANQDILILADELVWNKNSSTAKANGRVIMNYGETRILAESMVVNFETGEYWADEVRSIFSAWIFEANKIERSASNIKATDVVLYAGEPIQSNINLKLDSLIYDESNQTFEGRSIIPRVGKFPVGYIPRLRGNFQSESLLSPSFKIGKSQRLGWYAGYALIKNNYLDNFDTEGEFIGYQKRGFLLSSSGKHTSDSKDYFSTFHFDAGWINDQGNQVIDKGVNIEKNRGFAQLRYIYTNGNNIGFTTHMDWESDLDFMRDFKPEAFPKAQWNQSFSEINFKGKGFLLTAFVKGQVDSQHEHIQYLPQISFDAGPINYQGIYHNITAGLSKLIDRNSSGQNKQSLEKADLGYRAMKTFIIQPGILFTPSVSIRSQSFQGNFGKAQKISGEWASDLSMNFIGDFGYHNESLDIKGLTHFSKIALGHRRLQLLKTKNQDEIPDIFDLIEEVNLLPTDLLEIKNDRFLHNYDMFRLGWENTLQTHNRKLLRADLYLDYWKKNTLSPKRIPLFTRLEWFIAPWLSLTLKSNTDTQNGENFMRSTSINLKDGRFGEVNLAYNSFLDWNDFMTFRYKSLITEQIYASTTLWYDAGNDQLSLWAISISYANPTGIEYSIKITQRKGTRKEDDRELSLGLNLFSF